MTPKSVAELFESDVAHPLAMDLALLSACGPEWLGWEIETVVRCIRETFRVRTVSEINVQKLQACRTLHLVDSFWQRWEVFCPCALALSGTMPDFEVLDIPSAEACSVAADIANRIRRDVPWSDEVKQYLGVVHRHDGILCSQPPLDFVQIDTEGLPIDCARVQAMLADALTSGRPPDGMSVEAEQVRRLLDVRGVLEQSRKELGTELELLRHG